MWAGGGRECDRCGWEGDESVTDVGGREWTRK